MPLPRDTLIEEINAHPEDGVAAVAACAGALIARPSLTAPPNMDSGAAPRREDLPQGGEWV